MNRPHRVGDALSNSDDDVLDPIERLEQERAAWAVERETLQELLAQQQRVSQAGLVTAGLSHDIRNHVQSILGNAELALLADEPERMKLALELIAHTCRDIRETTDAFLSFTRRQQAVRDARFRIADVVKQCGRLMIPLARKSQVEFTLGTTEDGGVVGEQQLAVQAVVNLVSNAIRVCQDGGHVWLTASRPRPGTCRIEVRDDGPGVSEEVRGRLFRPFVGTEESSGGSGLGLFITRQSIRELGGSILMRTSPEGTVFRIDLPAIPG